MTGRPKAPPVLKVLMVCTGNICRSPTAEGVLQRLAEQGGLAHRVQVDSAGLSGYHVGEAPDRRSQAHALKRGYDLSKQRARQVCAADFEEFDVLLAMDRGHLDELKRQCPPDRQARIRLLMDYASPDMGREVPDPYYGGAAGFEDVLDRVEVACQGFLEREF